MTIRISVRIDDHIANKMMKSGLTTTEYTRRALETYSVNKDNAMQYQKVGTVEECISLLSGYRDEINQRLVNNSSRLLEDSVRQDDNICQTEVSDKSDENVRLSDKKEENVGQFVRQETDTVSDIFEESVRQMKQDTHYQTYKPYLELLSKLFNIHNSIPDATKQKIASETNTKRGELDQFLFAYKDEIKNIQWSIASESVHVDYDDGKKM